MGKLSHWTILHGVRALIDQNLISGLCIWGLHFSHIIESDSIEGFANRLKASKSATSVLVFTVNA